ncbi:nitrogen regulatory protein P-II [Thermocrinis albus DSM 14484]|uniref:Nitrogen regulatory protein P-II n=1 Tax=Thermocrinis albus (strain DSM 14484 / JCM 11386 / HI 11/12) TaxID=638303 RepID=D3SPF9_THEAH|nr:P-II family nitrogen regulator [Thermocrinis albus]ADC89046.1 nitrogen regulatory protein P-II [Thermocrinis albus DSM 14484]
MKEIWAVIRRDKYADTKRALDEIGCGAMSIHSVWGRGMQKGFVMSEVESEFASYATSAPKLVPTPASLVNEGATLTRPVVYVPKKLLVMVVPDDKVDAVVETIIKVNRTGNYGDGKIFIMPVEEAITVRTGEKEV